MRLLSRHWQTLREHDLVAAQPRLTFVGKDESGATFFVEIFSWKSADAVQIAHELPAVLAAWEPMEQLCEARLGRPAMEFPHVRPIELVAGG
ncbi:MAG TPA: hypothetical protein VNO70_07865 [Blastocatellia bacterium]|nr:hypothetical protein [Blastocatellia bacterium]